MNVCLHKAVSIVGLKVEDNLRDYIAAVRSDGDEASW